MISVVIPVYNEAENLERLCQRVAQSLSDIPHECILVDDGSCDESRLAYPDLMARYPQLRVFEHSRNAGQSAAFCTGVRAARHELVATLDGDLQNDPGDIPRLLEAYRAAGERHVLVAGNRVDRNDTWLRRVSSRVANRVRTWVLSDNCPDTGCSLKLFRRDDFMLLPQFNHMHRFLPALFARLGARVINVPVSHAERAAGESKYGVGNRLWVGLYDLVGVRWLMARPLELPIAERVGEEFK